MHILLIIFVLTSAVVQPPLALASECRISFQHRGVFSLIDTLRTLVQSKPAFHQKMDVIYVYEQRHLSYEHATSFSKSVEHNIATKLTRLKSFENRTPVTQLTFYNKVSAPQLSYYYENPRTGGREKWDPEFRTWVQLENSKPLTPKLPKDKLQYTLSSADGLTQTQVDYERLEYFHHKQLGILNDVFKITSTTVNADKSTEQTIQYVSYQHGMVEQYVIGTQTHPVEKSTHLRTLLEGQFHELPEGFVDFPAADSSRPRQ